MAYYGLCFKNSARTKKYEKNYLSPFFIPQKYAKKFVFFKKNTHYTSTRSKFSKNKFERLKIK